MNNRIEVDYSQTKNTLGIPKRRSRLNFDATLADAKAGLEVAETLAPVVAQKNPYKQLHQFDDVTVWEDGKRFPVYPHNALRSVQLRETVRRERGYVAIMAALAIGTCTAIGMYDGTFVNARNYIQGKIEAISSFLDRPNQEYLEDFRQKAHRFHSQR